jgi:PAS domain S-box-containing protein
VNCALLTGNVSNTSLKTSLNGGTHEYVAAITPRLRRIHWAAADLGVFVLDSAGDVMSWNAVAERVSGYRAEEILGRNLSYLYPAAASGRLTGALAFAAATGRSEGRASLVGKNEITFRAEVALTAVRGASRVLCGFACLIRNIGPSEFHGSPETAFDASRLKSAFLSNISHEFLTPLNIIIGYNDLIAEHLAEARDTSQDEYLDAVARASNRLLRTFNAVLDYSKLESKSLKANPRSVALIPLIRAMLDEVEPQALQKNLSMAFTFEEEDAAVVIDEYCLRHSLSNLFDNAIKFTERGGVAARVYRGQRGTTCVDISDTGIGVEAAYLPHLLEPFSQEDSGITRRFEGAGLGLALASRYLELNGARLTVRSEKGCGSVFTIHFAKIGTFAPGRFELSNKTEGRWKSATKR